MKTSRSRDALLIDYNKNTICTFPIINWDEEQIGRIGFIVKKR